MTTDRPSVTPAPGDALVIVDVQGDFVTGSLAVPGGAEVIPPLNRAAAAFHVLGLPVFATRDWHPADHVSFAAQGGPWPPHCVAGTPGADAAAGLVLPAGTVLVHKATTPEADAYSAFSGTDLAAELRRRRVHRVIVGGLATDYCVLNTVTDAIGEGFAAVVLEDAIRAVDVQPGDGDRAEEAMRAAGARFATVGDIGALTPAGVWPREPKGGLPPGAPCRTVDARAHRERRRTACPGIRWTATASSATAAA